MKGIHRAAHVGAAIALVSMRVSAQQSSTAPKWAQDFLRTWYTVYNGGDAVGVAKLFTADATFGADTGRASITATLGHAFATTRYRCAGNFEAFREIDRMAVAWGVESCTEAPKTSGRSRSTRERWLIVFERQVDGNWLISRETWQELEP